MKKRRCKECDILLNKKNWPPSSIKSRHYTCNECDNKRRRNARSKLKQEVFAAYGGKCLCRAYDVPEFLTIDHIDGAGAQHRLSIPSNSLYPWLKKNGFPKDNFQLLCFNCNCAKGIYGICPHRNKRNR